LFRLGGGLGLGGGGEGLGGGGLGGGELNAHPAGAAFANKLAAVAAPMDVLYN
jgi:hypothetical protein